MRTLSSALLALLVLPAVHADPIPVPGPGSAGTPESIDLPYTCDPVGLVCVGPVHEPAPAGVSVEAGGFVVLIDPTGNPGSVFGPSYHNVTAGDATVPVVLCPNGCNVPASPTAGIEGGASVEASGPLACAVSLLEPTSVSCDPLGCDPTDFGGCGLLDPRDHCVREGTDEVPDCFFPAALGCDSLYPSSCAWWLFGLVVDTAIDAANEAVGLVPDPDDLCLEGGMFPTCLVPENECVDDPRGCVPDDPLGLIIEDCSPEIYDDPIYVCRNNNSGLLGRQIEIRDPNGITRI